MTRPEQMYVVRVRAERGDAIVEDMRSGQRAHASELRDVGTVIARLLETGQARPDNQMRRKTWPGA